MNFTKNDRLYLEKLNLAFDTTLRNKKPRKGHRDVHIAPKPIKNSGESAEFTQKFEEGKKTSVVKDPGSRDELVYDFIHHKSYSDIQIPAPPPAPPKEEKPQKEFSAGKTSLVESDIPKVVEYDKAFEDKFADIVY